jgi:hypothetical protein
MDIKGIIVERTHTYDYIIKSQQYASNLNINSDIFTPYKIIYPKNDRDIFEVIKYAKKNNIAIAVRTGGHQYIGMSSTSGLNIQLDLSQTYKDFDVSQLYKKKLITCGISLKLEELVSKFKEYKCFTPHGGCADVCLGGHVSSGGKLFVRMFGSLGDQISSFKLITATSNKKLYITKKTNPELFYAVLGGSPGNFGIITSITFKVYMDEDYPYSSGISKSYLYNKEHFKKLLDLMLKYNCDKTLPKNFGFLITTTSTFLINKYVQLILLDVRWYAKNKEESELRHKYYYEILATAGIGLSLNLDTKDFLTLDKDKYVPLSILSEFDVDLKKNREISAIGNNDIISSKRLELHTNESNKLISRNFSDIFMKKINSYKGEVPFVMQIMLASKHNSTYYRNKNNGTSYSHRDDNLVISILTPTIDIENEKYCQNYLQETHNLLIGKKKSFAKKDLRDISFPYSNNNKSKEYNLDKMKNMYYDSNSKYKKLLKIKKKYDPDKIFSPNTFCIGGIK